MDDKDALSEIAMRRLESLPSFQRWAAQTTERIRREVTEEAERVRREVEERVRREAEPGSTD